MARRSVTALGCTLSFQDAGPADGEPIVLLHGLASDSDTWDRAIPGLSRRGLRVIALDLIGHGQSDKPRNGYLLPDFAASKRVAALDQRLQRLELRALHDLHVVLQDDRHADRGDQRRQAIGVAQRPEAKRSTVQP